MTAGFARHDAEFAGHLTRSADGGPVELQVHDYFSDDELWGYLQGLDVSVLPYQFGTHSGWLEACYDLGTWVAAPDCGFYAEQRPCLTYAATGPERRRSLVTAVRTAHADWLAGEAAPRADLADAAYRAQVPGPRPRASSTQRRWTGGSHARRDPRCRPAPTARSRSPGGLESLTWALVRGLRQRGVDVTLFAGPGSDPALGARELDGRLPSSSATAARRDASMPPEPWLREHHAYLQVMLELEDRRGRGRHPQQQPALPPAGPRAVLPRADADHAAHAAHAVARAGHRA